MFSTFVRLGHEDTKALSLVWLRNPGESGVSPSKEFKLIAVEIPLRFLTTLFATSDQYPMLTMMTTLIVSLKLAN
jgi:hypothetical protein